MAEQQALLERPIEAAAHSDSGNVTHTWVHTLCLIHCKYDAELWCRWIHICTQAAINLMCSAFL